MANNIRDIAIIPSSCRNRIIPVDAGNRRDALAANGILHCGLGDNTTGYHFRRSDPKDHLFIYTRSGVGEVNCGGKSARTVDGEFVMLPAHVPGEYQCGPAFWNHLWFHLSPQAWPLDGNALRHGTARYCVEIERLLSCYYDESLRAAGDTAVILGHLGEVAAALLRRELARDIIGSGPRMRRQIDRLVREVDSYLANDWNLDQIAQIMCMGKRNALYTIRKYCSCTPMELVARLRMERAAQLLRQTDYKVSTVGQMVGYTDQFAFSTAFRRFHGRSPREYRNG